MRDSSRGMTALVEPIKEFFTGKKETTLANAYSALNANAKISEAKQRICGLLDAKIQEGKKLDLAEARYAFQHCKKTRNEVNTAIQPMFRVSPQSPPEVRNFMTRALDPSRSPISPLTYPNQELINYRIRTGVNLGGGKRRKTRKLKLKRKHTRKH